MTANLFSIRYSCGDTHEYPVQIATQEAMRALYPVPCPECRQHPSVHHRYFPSPAEPGAAYQFVLEAADGAPLTAALLDCVYLCEEHEEEAIGKAVPIPPGVERRVGVIIGQGLCDLCSGTIAIAKVATLGRKAKHIELPFDAEGGLFHDGEWRILSPTEAEPLKRALHRRAMQPAGPDVVQTSEEHTDQGISDSAPGHDAQNGADAEEGA